jgi:hypothetical protein
VALINTARVRAELRKVGRIKRPEAKGKLVEALVGYVFGCVPGLSLDDTNVINVYQSEEIDLVFWNDQEAHGVRFLDCPLIICLLNLLVLRSGMVQSAGKGGLRWHRQPPGGSRQRTLRRSWRTGG